MNWHMNVKRQSNMKRFCALAAALCALAPLAAMAQDAGVSARVHVVTLRRGSLPIRINAFGRVRPSETAKRVITAPVAARVERLSVQFGEEVRRGAPIVTLVPTPGSLAAYKQAQVAVKVTQQLVDRDRSLVKVHLTTLPQLASAEKDLADAKASLAALTEEGAEGPHTYNAPFDAIVTKIDSGPGSVVSQGQPLVELARPSGLVVTVGVNPAQALSVRAGNPATLAPVTEDASTVPGQVLLRSAVVDSANGLVPVQIGFPRGKLIVGETVRATITIGEKIGYLVPHPAILVNDSGHPYIVQAMKDMTAKKVAVRVIGTDGSTDVIEGPLVATAPVVLAGNYQLDNGMKLRIADAKASPSNGKTDK
jgi:RND family efflux transporter MFP subunit